MNPVTLRPAVTKGPVTGSSMRVVYNSEKAAVVSSKETKHLTLTGPPRIFAGGKTVLATTEGDLTIVKQGGCTCGKPWLTKPSAADLLAE
jgi:hypothetical protein